MSKFEKLIQKIFAGQQIFFSEAERLLLDLGYEYRITGSHHTFRKPGFDHVMLKQRPQLMPHQLVDLKNALRDHGYDKEADLVSPEPEAKKPTGS